MSDLRLVPSKLERGPPNGGSWDLLPLQGLSQVVISKPTRGMSRGYLVGKEQRRRNTSGRNLRSPEHLPLSHLRIKVVTSRNSAIQAD